MPGPACAGAVRGRRARRPRSPALLTALGWGPSRLTVLEHLGGAARGGSRGRRRDAGASGASPTSTRSRSNAAPGRARGRCRGSPACPTTRSSMTGNSPSARSAPRRWRRWRRWPAKPCGMSAPAAARSRSNGCAPTSACAAVAVERDAARAAMIARNAAALGVPGLRIVRRLRRPRRSPACRRPMRSLSAAGSASRALLPALWPALPPGGRLVANVVSAEGECAAAGLAGAPWRRADPDRGQPRRARRRASSVAAVGERDPACRRQARMR